MTDPVTKEFVVVEKSGGSDHDSVLMVQHLAPPGGGHDPLEAADLELARKTRTYLVTRFPCGYEWCVRSDIGQGVVMISIPLLMGVNQWMVINLHKVASFADAVLHCAGEILERYRLSRETFSMAAVLDARAKHSALVMPRRKVPS